MGPLIPLFWTSGDVWPGFQSQGGSLVCFLTCVITFGATPADSIEVSMAAKPFKSTYLDMSTSIGGGSGQTGARTHKFLEIYKILN